MPDVEWDGRVRGLFEQTISDFQCYDDDDDGEDGEGEPVIYLRYDDDEDEGEPLMLRCVPCGCVFEDVWPTYPGLVKHWQAPSCPRCGEGHYVDFDGRPEKLNPLVDDSNPFRIKGHEGVLYLGKMQPDGKTLHMYSNPPNPPKGWPYEAQR